MIDKSSASWSDELEIELIVAYKQAIRNPRFVCSGGKNHRSAGWSKVLEDLKGQGAIENADYNYLVQLSGFGDGFSDEKWEELDRGPRKLKLSRFRDKPFVHYDAMSNIIGDSMATGEDITSVDDVLQSKSGSNALNVGDLDDAAKRAKILYNLKKNRKRKQDDSLAKSQSTRDKHIASMNWNLRMLPTLYAAKNGLTDLLQAEPLGSPNDSGDESKDD
ncbi:hypothetical protein LEN26_013182 [Aphanomyces euteiches]|nr:hypothetical protein LEN26_013182 [Aphanomyces euteiches]